MIKEIPYKDREEWLAIRKKLGIGGSEAGAVVGLDDYKSPYSLWAEKTGRTPEFEGNMATKVGTYLEALVADIFTEETGKKVRRKNRILVNDEYPWAFADVDRMVVGENAILEIKTTSSFDIGKSVRGGEYPDKWYAQMTHYLSVTGADRAYLAVLVGNRDFHVFTLERDQAEIDALMKAEETFWKNNVEKDIPPAPDGSDATTDAIGTIYRESRGGEVELFGRDKLIEEHFRLKQTVKELESRKSEIENILKTDMGEAEKAFCGSYKVSWKTQEKNLFDKDAFAKAYPSIDLTPYYKTSTSRPFKLTEMTPKN